jgi:hypothetical protein
MARHPWYNFWKKEVFMSDQWNTAHRIRKEWFSFSWIVLLAVALTACQNTVTTGIRPRPTEHRLDEEAEARNKTRRKEYFEMMHRAAPGVD